MKVPISTVVPDIDHQTLQMVAEIFACHNPDPVKRNQHRITKLASFPVEYQSRVRDLVNRVIAARNQPAQTNLNAQVSDGK